MVQSSGRDAGADYKEAFRCRLFGLVSGWERVYCKRVSHTEIAEFIANRLGEKAVHPTQVGRWINGETLPEAYRVQALASYFGATGAFLGHGEGDGPEFKQKRAAGDISA
ncbi:hypothetical protein LCGC14_2291670 [marine sediment metagenome]|uniref:Uncharacterized protein n=1 Tax=marine sediment metagenome TaxID=412755 RepID=A0A0F9CR33_9ZZZZ